MWLDNVTFTEYQNEEHEWKLENCTFGQINLIVGLNTAGKTRTINVIKSLADLFSNSRILRDSKYYVSFKNNSESIDYKYFSEHSKVIKEELLIDNQEYLLREADGKGKIKAFELKGKDMLTFKIPVEDCAVVAKRDSIQHPFLEDLYNWGCNLSYYGFSTTLNTGGIMVKKGIPMEDLESRKNKSIILNFHLGLEKYKEEYKKLVIKDMESIGYNIDDIGFDYPKNLTFNPDLLIENSAIFSIYVKEKDLKCKTYQHNMSAGMNRALSLIIELNYFKLSMLPSCILIDDIGEGLDFERSKSLINLIVEKVKDTSVQLIMTSNDRFVMNAVPLEYWSILQRKGSVCSTLNYRNSRKIFDDFDFLGLGNFDFFSGSFYKGES